MMRRQKRDHGAGCTARGVVTWALATAAAAGLLSLALPVLTGPLPAVMTFEEALARVAAGAVSGCTAWGWLAVTVVVAEALAGRSWQPLTPTVPPWLRRLVLAGCGVALAATTVPAAATPGGGHVQRDDARHRPAAALSGLPIPDRTVGRWVRAPLQRPSSRTVVVAPGDCLWSIAAAQLPATATDAEVDALWRRIYARNRAAVGPDPGLIHPGLRLSLPAGRLR